MIQIDIHSQVYADFEIKADVQFEQGEIAVITGESGAGKTSLLNLVAGVKQPSKFQIWRNSKNIDKCLVHINGQEKSKRMDPRIAYVFQDTTLFPNMSVLKNLEYALSKKGDSNLIDGYLKEVGMLDFKNRMPNQLSGGQKQRIDLIRSLITKPQLLLLDEPANEQDKKNRSIIQKLLLEEKKRGRSMLIVSHDQQEIEVLADIVFTMEAGRIINSYRRKDLIEKAFQIEGTIVKIEDGKSFITTKMGTLKIAAEPTHLTGSKIQLKQKDINLELVK